MTVITAGSGTRVQVTADDIADGFPGKPCDCPIASAIERATGRIVSVKNDEVSIVGAPYAARLPHAAQVFISRFDTALPVEPFEFDLTWQEVTS